MSIYFRGLVSGIIGLSILTLALLALIPPSGIPAHIICWQQNLGLIFLHLTGDMLVWSAYTAIPFLILYLMVRGRIDHTSSISFPSLLVWGALFVWSSGQTYLLHALEMWFQIQWRRGYVKLTTAIISWVFVVLLIRQRKRLLTFARAAHRALLAEEAEAEALEAKGSSGKNGKNDKNGGEGENK